VSAATSPDRLQELLEERAAHPERAAAIDRELARLSRGASPAARAERRPAHREGASFR